jgi:predicted O-methyltransferase YrrM
MVSHCVSVKDDSKEQYSEDLLRSVIGDTIYQMKVLHSWRSIELDAPLMSRQTHMLRNIGEKVPFWNIHVALAFLADRLQPESYLEIGVRTGGSMVQVLGASKPQRVVAMDLWDGSYSSLPNTLAYTQTQLERFQAGTCKSFNIRYVQGNSHIEMKKLIRQGLTFDLITVDGDHTMEGAREDLEDAISMLSHRGAIVFDDIIHKSFPFLLTLTYQIRDKHPDLTLLLNTSQDNGCAIFLKNISWDSISAPGGCAGKKMRIAGEGVTGKNLTQIQESSEFENGLRSLIMSTRPASIIETGTYLAQGTTRIIASSLRDAGLTGTAFYSIECNPKHYHQAQANLRQCGLQDHVRLLLGLSLPRVLLPTPDRIHEETVRNQWGGDIFVDHQEHERVALYHRETDFPYLPEDLLGACLESVDYRPDIVLLDSGGHMGHVEFKYLVERLQGACYIVLDDIFHIKHHRSFMQIQSDPRFTILAASREKFGFCIAKFTPA